MFDITYKNLMVRIGFQQSIKITYKFISIDVRINDYNNIVVFNIIKFKFNSVILHLL